MKVYGRVAVEFEVDETLFSKDPDQAIQQAIQQDKAITRGGDNYLPASWNDLADDVDFEVPSGSILKKE